MAIRIEMLRCFATVARTGSLAEASDALGRTPSAVSMMLKQFEDHIGAPLFETTRKSHLTPIGTLIYEQARREVTHFENTIAMIEGLAKSEQGYLRLAVTPSVGAVLLPPVLHAFTKTYPDVQIDVRDMDSAAIAEHLQNDRADIGIGTLPELDTMTRFELTSDAFGVVCRADHPLARNWDQLTWRDMHGQPFIANGLCHLIADPDFAPILDAARMMVHTTTSLMGLVRAGVGVTVLPRLAVSLPSDDITFLPLADTKARRILHVSSRAPNTLLPAARSFHKMLQDMT